MATASIVDAYCRFIAAYQVGEPTLGFYLKVKFKCRSSIPNLAGFKESFEPRFRMDTRN